jgi:hypothetical protein
MMRRRLASVTPSPEAKPPLPLMAYEHIKQCLQVAQARMRADAAIISAADRHERDRKRALAFVKR